MILDLHHQPSAVVLWAAEATCLPSSKMNEQMFYTENIDFPDIHKEKKQKIKKQKQSTASE